MSDVLFGAPEPAPDPPPDRQGLQRLALGVRYRGSDYHGWQSQADGRTVQDVLEHALSTFAATRVSTLCAGRTDTGVHAIQQVVHIDAPVQRDPASWVRGTNRYLPSDVAVQWCVLVDRAFHARASARSRRYRYVCLESPVRPSLDEGLVGWVFKPLDGDAMRAAAPALIGRHDFTSFRAAECQAASPVKELRRLDIHRAGRRWHFDFEADAFLHHMVRNIMGTLIAIGQGRHAPQWMHDVLAARSRAAAAPTFGAQGLYFVGPTYDAKHGIPPSPDASLPMPYAD